MNFFGKKNILKAIQQIVFVSPQSLLYNSIYLLLLPHILIHKLICIIQSGCKKIEYFIKIKSTEFSYF
jgi:hypothetical protein